MKERPILFSALMVRALLDGRKTQTRRVVKAKYLPWIASGFQSFLDGKWNQRPLPYGRPGDRLWVRENIRFDSEYGHYYAATMPGSLGNPSGQTYLYMEKELSGKELPDRSIPSIHMPRWASRITLDVTGVRVERLRDISEADAIAEGVYSNLNCNGMWTGDGDTHTSKADGPVRAYQALWESINGPGTWGANPWVWVVEFKRIQGGAT